MRIASRVPGAPHCWHTRALISSTMCAYQRSSSSAPSHSMRSVPHFSRPVLRCTHVVFTFARGALEGCGTACCIGGRGSVRRPAVHVI